MWKKKTETKKDRQERERRGGGEGQGRQSEMREGRICYVLNRGSEFTCHVKNMRDFRVKKRIVWEGGEIQENVRRFKLETPVQSNVIQHNSTVTNATFVTLILFIFLWRHCQIKSDNGFMIVPTIHMQEIKSITTIWSQKWTQSWIDPLLTVSKNPNYNPHKI